MREDLPVGTEGVLPWVLALLIFVLPLALVIFGVVMVIRHWNG